MSEFQEGRVAATFQVGAHIENTKDSYQKEILGLEGMKAAMSMAVQNLEEQAKQIRHDQAHGRLPLKEAEVGLKYVGKCIEQTQRLFFDIEAKRNAAIGALRALEKVVSDVKAVWDKETVKLKEIQEFESTEPKDYKQRPVGYVPKEKPLDEYKKGDVAQVKSESSNLKRNKKAPVTRE